MLQRIQTVILFLVSLLMIVDVFSPVWINVNESNGESYILYSAFFEYIPSAGAEAQTTFFPYTIVSIIALVAAGVAFYEVFQYKDRVNQMKMGALNSIIMTICLGLSVWFATDIQEVLGESHDFVKTHAGSYGYGLFIPAAAMVLNLIANRLIRKDEKLVRSVDRIR